MAYDEVCQVPDRSHSDTIIAHPGRVDGARKIAHGNTCSRAPFYSGRILKQYISGHISYCAMSLHITGTTS